MTNNKYMHAKSLHNLQAGMISMRYENGSLRHLKVCNEEVLRMVYVALRDANWETITPFLSNEKISSGNHHFIISYDCHYKINHTPVFKWKIRIEGNSNNEISFNAIGKALAAFKKNRAGLCILHPIKSCTGQSCEITDPDGQVSQYAFPKFISPHQPFKNIREMQWTSQGDARCLLQFEGDVFETEDQRNWTDASYKTYSTPLELPFPVWLQKGETIRQKMTFRIISKPPVSNADKKESARPVFIRFMQTESSRLPAIGSMQPIHGNSPDKYEAGLIQRLRLSHYRTDLKLWDKNWHAHFLQSVNEAQDLQTRLEIALHVSDNFKNELDHFIAISRNMHHLVQKIILTGPSRVTGGNVISYVPALKKNFPHALTGGGTDCYYAELNRNIFNTAGLDFISFSMTPQVHAFDNLTLIENIEAQHDAVISAHELYPGMPVHISPVTLLPRFNPDATEETAADSHTLNTTSDHRQMSLFAAGWTLGSICQLAAAGTSAITYYETTGNHGLMRNAANNDHYKSLLRIEQEPVSPSYSLLYFVQEFTGGELYAGICNEELKCSGVLLKKGNRQRYIVANHLPRALNIGIDHLPARTLYKILDTDHIKEASLHPASFIAEKPAVWKDNEICLPEYGIAILDVS